MKGTSYYTFDFVVINAGTENNLETKIEQIMQIAAGFMCNIPYLASIVIELVIHFHQYYAVWDLQLLPAQLQFNSCRAMQYLGQVNAIVCSKSAFVNHHQQYVAAFKVGGK